MADCFGDTPIATKADREMVEWLGEEANRLGMNKSELLRRLLDHYRESRAGELACPHCNNEIIVRL